MALWIHSLSFNRGSTRTTTSWGPIVFKTRMPTSCRVYKNLLMGGWPILCSLEQAFKGPARTRQNITTCQSSTAKKSFPGPWSATRGRVGLMTLKTPRASPWCERPSAEPMGSPVWWSAEASQLDDVELDSSNKAEAARQVKASSKPTSVPMLDMSLPRLPFLVGTAVLPRCLKIFCCQREMGPREISRENKILFYRTSMYVIGNMPSTDVLRNESERIILLIAWNAIGQEILANFIVK